MSYIFYNSLEQVPYNSKVPFSKLNANKKWAEHSYNLYVLKHIVSSTNDIKEKIQANKEVLIAQKKLLWWERHPNFSLQSALFQRKDMYKI